MADAITNVNQKLISSASGILKVGTLAKLGGWILFIILIVGGGYYLYYYYKQKKLFNKNITVFEIIGGYYQPAFKDKAKTVKIGTGGFEILYLKKAKVWRIAYGGRIGKDTYYFFVLPDGYWVNGMLSADIKTTDKNGGLFQVITTNPSMRAQYTSLEKQIDSIHADKKSFMDKYGAWVFSIGYLVIAGVFLWLMFREMTQVTNRIGGLVDQLTELAKQMMALSNNQPSNLVPA